jgi:hypothetical protein
MGEAVGDERGTEPAWQESLALHADILSMAVGEAAICRTDPPGAIAYSRPDSSSGAIRSPPKRPKLAGATAMPPRRAAPSASGLWHGRGNRLQKRSSGPTPWR